jgi:cation:H+ antiporter
MSDHTRQYEIDPYHYVLLLGTFAITVPGLYVGLMHIQVSPVVGSLLFGTAILGAAFVLSWAAEAIQVDMSESLAVAILALLAVLPEYAVDFVFTWKAAHDPQQAHYAIANMTGANRLLVGLGWPVVLFVSMMVKKKKFVVLDKSQRVEIFYLAMATIYSFTIPLKGKLTLIDTVILVTLYILYALRAAQLESKEPEMVGPPRIVVNLSKVPRRILTYLFFLYSGVVIFFVTEPFAGSLVATGRHLGVNEFLLVQWLAPVASEAPEFIVAIVWAMRGAATSAMKALISSKVNQWTLLIGTIPLVYAIAGGSIKAFQLDSLQQHELYLTAAQSLFAVAVLVDLKLDRQNGILLLTLFTAQLIVEKIRLEVAAVYLLLALYYHIRHRRDLIPAARVGLGLKEK